MFYKVKEVIPMEDMKLKIKFENNEIKIYDVECMIKKYKIFEELRNRELFERVKVDQGGYGISWNDEIDLECNELWKNGIRESEYK